MPYEWEEAIPQPEPPKNRLRLAVQTWADSTVVAPSWCMDRPATLGDIAKALGVTADELELWLKRRLYDVPRPMGDQQISAVSWAELREFCEANKASEQLNELRSKVGQLRKDLAVACEALNAADWMVSNYEDVWKGPEAPSSVSEYWAARAKVVRPRVEPKETA